VETLKLRIQSFDKALSRLKYTLNKLEFARNNYNAMSHEDFLAYRDSEIKRFEMCFDLFWKILKDYIQKWYAIEVLSPKKVFQEAFKQGLVSEEEIRYLLNMVDDRILRYIFTMKKWLKRLASV
jgi:nucleotidyltransferase substrate binding protein (TIGR01987 family)